MYIGLSKKQLEKLIAGEEVGKRPYKLGDTCFNTRECETSIKYDGDLRLFIRILPEKEERQEHDGAFF